jgi:DNA-binding Lrp family transcriptional regulator
MVTAIVLMKVEPSKINEVAEKLVKIPQISEVYSVGGRFDLIAMIRAASNEKLSSIVTDNVVQIEGLISTETCIAFRAYSSYDLERMFDME